MRERPLLFDINLRYIFALGSLSSPKEGENKIEEVSLKDGPKSSMTQKSLTQASVCQLFLKASKTPCFLSEVAYSYQL